MGRKWEKTTFEGVRYRVHATRKVSMGAVKQFDQYYAIRYQKDGKRVEEGLGWTSEGWTAEKAFVKLVELKEAARNNLDAPKHLSEERERNAEAARQKKRQAQAQAKERITFGEYFRDTYWPTAKLTRKNPNDKVDEQHFRLWLEPVVGAKVFKDITPMHLERVKRNLLEAGRSPRTLEYVFATFRQVWNMAKRDKIIREESPTAEVKRPKVDNQRIRFYSLEEASTLLERTRSYSERAYWMSAISLYTGLRAGEVFKLIWRDINFNDGLICVRGPKNEATRFAYITTPVEKILKEMTPGEPGELLFLNEDGNPFTEAPSSFRNALASLGWNDGITDRKQRFCFHSLRHTFGSWLVKNGVHLLVVKELMGHKTLAMTERYVHVGDNDMRKAAMSLHDLGLENRLPEAA